MRYFMAGYVDRALDEAETAVQLDPENANAHGLLGNVLLGVGEFEEAERHFRERLRLGNPDGASDIVEAAVLAGDPARARSLANGMTWSNPEDRERIGRFLDAVEDPSKVPDFVAYLRANPVQGRRAENALMTLGQYEVAFELSGGLVPSVWAVFGADARALPEFEKYVRDNRLSEVWDALGPPPACRKVGEAYDCTPEDTP